MIFACKKLYTSQKCGYLHSIATSNTKKPFFYPMTKVRGLARIVWWMVWFPVFLLLMVSPLGSLHSAHGATLRVQNDTQETQIAKWSFPKPACEPKQPPQLFLLHCARLMGRSGLRPLPMSGVPTSMKWGHHNSRFAHFIRGLRWLASIKSAT